MTNTPDEIKKGLECCSISYADCNNECPYKPDCDGSQILKYALAIIQRLEAELEDMTARYKIADDCAKKKGEMNEKLYAELATVKAERDAMKEALGLMVYQYCVSGTELDHRYMCAGETAFRVLGLEQYGDTRTLESWLFPECQDKEE